MVAIVWDAPGMKFWRAGVNAGVLYAPDGEVTKGFPWNGLVNVTENVSGGELESYYYDGRKYMDVILTEDFQATIEAFSAPAEFAQCDGSRELAIGLFVTGQPRIPFGLSYKNNIGNDLDGFDHGYELHLIWNCTVSPTENVHSTINDQAELSTMSWQINTAPPISHAFKPTAHFVIDSTASNPNLPTLLDMLYGTDETDPYLPSQQQVIDTLEFSG